MINASKIALLILGLFGGGNSGAGTPLSNRNYVVDGNFENWIAPGGVATGVGGLTHAAATMYYNYAGASGNATISLATFAPGTEPIGMTSPARFALTHAQTVAATTNPYCQQVMESVYTLSGRSATFSCWLWCASGTQTVPSVFISQVFGTGGSPSASLVTSVPVNWVLTTTPQRFSVRVDVPSTATKTLGSNGNDGLSVGINFPTGATYTIYTAQWQFEQSSSKAPSAGLPTAFEYRGYEAELARVQRFYETGNTVFNGPTTSGSTYGSSRPYIVSKRATPSVTLGMPGLANFPASISLGGASTADNLAVYSVANATGSAGYYLASFIADARL
jgi:hypothetical protein